MNGNRKSFNGLAETLLLTLAEYKNSKRDCYRYSDLCRLQSRAANISSHAGDDE